MGISAIVIARDEEERIQTCLESLSFADEIVVMVDSRTTDNTVQVARHFTKKVYTLDWPGYGKMREEAVARAKHDWILWLDADERVPPELAGEIQQVLAQKTLYAGYQMPRKAFFLGRWIRYGGWYPGYVTRLYYRDSASFSNSLVHEKITVQGRIGTLSNALHHHTDETIRHYYEKWNLYTSLAAEEIAGDGKTFHIPDLLFRPLFMFLKMYIIRLGFLDGMEGFMLAVFSANYVYTKYAKLWELNHSRCLKKDV